MTDVVFSLSTETLADLKIRGMMRPPDRFLQGLAGSPRVDGLMAVDAVRWWGSFLKHPRSPHIEGITGRVTHLRPWRMNRHERSDKAGVEAAIQRLERSIKRRVERAGMHRPAIVSFNPLLAGFGDFSWAGPVTFYARDDWASFPARREFWEQYERSYQALRARERGVIAVSKPLLERIGPTGPAAVVPNGIDPPEWLVDPKWPTQLGDRARPISVYAGTIDDRIDLELARECVAAPGTALFVGPADPAVRDELTQMGAVHMVAADREQLAEVLLSCDVGLIPHQRTSLTEAMSPLKLYEYRAAGLPVATVSLPPIEAEASTDRRIVLSERGQGAFTEAIERAAAAGRDNEVDRQRYLDEASWEARHATALDVVLRS